MITFSHTITTPQGLHARPVVVICRAVLDHLSSVSVQLGERGASGSDMVGLMGLDGRGGDTLTFTIDGPDEHEVATEIRAICTQML
ncbi:HPr family phosphocarrier protein [Collinsella sp. An7]|uniref:HPr family phosphocarrier protein n=1 Tax=Collinsella sp. An7 TaxID=1965651 RepID=UPI001302E012|nr:HPr family phosphocarrier protein [Collinsella sp. An7]